MSEGAHQRPVTEQTLAENERKQAAYALRRRVWTERQLQRGPTPEPEAASEPAQQGGAPTPIRTSRRRGTLIHDKRQTRMDL